MSKLAEILWSQDWLWGIDGRRGRRIQSLTTSFNWCTEKRGRWVLIKQEGSIQKPLRGWRCSLYLPRLRETFAWPAEEELINKGEGVSTCGCSLPPLSSLPSPPPRVCARTDSRHQQSTPLRQTAGMRVHRMSLEYQ